MSFYGDEAAAYIRHHRLGSDHEPAATRSAEPDWPPADAGSGPVDLHQGVRRSAEPTDAESVQNYLARFFPWQ